MDVLFCDIDGVLRTHQSDLWWSRNLNAPIPDKVFDRKFSHPVKKFAVLDDNIQDIKKYIKPDNIIRCDVSIGFEDDRLVDRLIDILA